MSNGIGDDNPIAKTAIESCGAVKNGHFVLTPKEIPPGSGNWRDFHADVYVNKDEAYWTPMELRVMARQMILPYIGKKVDAIVGPEKGAISLATLASLELTELQDPELLPPSGCIHACWAEKEGKERMIIGRIFKEHILSMPGCKVLIVEDIGVSGSSARKTVLAAQELGAEVIGVAFIAIRKKLTEDDLAGAKPTWLLFIPINMWPEKPEEGEEPCPMCREDGMASVSLSIGKGKEFYQREGISLPE